MKKKIIFYLKNLRANFASLIYKTFSIKPKLSIFFKIYKSDKYEQYANNYDTIFATLDRKKKLKILEIGVGGHNKDYDGGNSILALSSFFPNSLIIGADIVDKSFLNKKNIETIILDQSNQSDLENLAKKFRTFDIIIDDGSHFCDHQRISFSNLFHHLNDDGVYIIEDMSGSYEKALRGDPDLSVEKNNITYFSQFCHNVNSHMLYKEIYDQRKKFIDIEKIFYFPKMVAIFKKNKKHKIVSKNYLEINLSEYSNRKNKSGLVDYNIEKKKIETKQFYEEENK